MTQRHHVQHSRMMFVTTNCSNRNPIFTAPIETRLVVDSIYATQERHPFYLYGFVVMPDHCHLLLMPPDGASISRIMFDFKRRVSFGLGIGSIWQKRFDCRLISSENVFDVLHYIHLNPVRSGLCNEPEKYPWSSASGKWDVSDIDAYL